MSVDGPRTYSHDGSAWKINKDQYVHNGTNFEYVMKSYVHDGSAWKIAHRAFRELSVSSTGRTLLRCYYGGWYGYAYDLARASAIDSMGDWWIMSGASPYSWFNVSVAAGFFSGVTTHLATRPGSTVSYFTISGAPNGYTYIMFDLVNYFVVGNTGYEICYHDGQLYTVTADWPSVNTLAYFSAGVNTSYGASSCYRLCSSGGVLYSIDGEHRLQSWNGAYWTTLSSTYVDALFDGVGGISGLTQSGYIQLWNGTNWIPLGGDPYLRTGSAYDGIGSVAQLFGIPNTIGILSSGQAQEVRYII